MEPSIFVRTLWGKGLQNNLVDPKPIPFDPKRFVYHELLFVIDKSDKILLVFIY